MLRSETCEHAHKTQPVAVATWLKNLVLSISKTTEYEYYCCVHSTHTRDTCTNIWTYTIFSKCRKKNTIPRAARVAYIICFVSHVYLDLFAVCCSWLRQMSKQSSLSWSIRFASLFACVREISCVLYAVRIHELLNYSNLWFTIFWLDIYVNLWLVAAIITIVYRKYDPLCRCIHILYMRFNLLLNACDPVCGSMYIPSSSGLFN